MTKTAEAIRFGGAAGAVRAVRDAAEGGDRESIGFAVEGALAGLARAIWDARDRTPSRRMTRKVFVRMFADWAKEAATTATSDA